MTYKNENIIYLNVQSLFANYNSVRLLLEKNQPAVLMCSETCLTNQINNFEVNVENYNLERCDSHSRHTGGVAVYIKENITYKILHNECYLNNIWCLVYEIKKCDLKGVYVLLYRSPSSSMSSFLNYYEILCNDFILPTKICLTVGDFNIDISKNTTYSQLLCDIILSSGQKQIVDFYTRRTPTSKTIIDLVVTNSPKFKVCAINDKISDHETMQINVPVIKNNDLVEKTYISWKNYSKAILIEILIRKNWTYVYLTNNINDRLMFVCETIVEAVKLLVETKTIKCDIKNRWFDDDLRLLKRDKNISLTKAKITNLDEDWNTFEYLNKNYKKLIKIKSDTYAKQTIKKASSDPKKLWKCINNLTKENSCDNRTCDIKFDGVPATNNIEDIAENFNNYFIDSLNEIVSSIPIVQRGHNSALVPVMSSMFKFSSISVEDLEHLLLTFKNKSNKGDLLTTAVLKDAFCVVGYFFVQIINDSFYNGDFPKYWKLSTIVPIPKIKNTCNSCNFRPINVLPISEKLIECVVKKQFLKYIEESNILCKYQSGFRFGHSCETSLNYLLTTWKSALDINKCIITVFLDFKRAFETIDREILLQKLYYYGVRNTEITWFRNYLNGREQRTSYRNITSNNRIVEHGVPQGSVLGPLLFILYINDIEKCLKYCKINLFADDTLLHIITTNVEDGISKMNEDLKNISEWINQNKLKINVDKSKWMIISLKQIINVNSVLLNDVKIDRVTFFKYLGVTIDENLKFDIHLTEIKKKISSKVYLLSRLRKKINVNIAKLIYESSIQVLFDYCSSILFLCSTTQLRALQTLQNRALRVILKRPRRTNCGEMLSDLNLLNVTNRIELNVLSIVYKLKNNMLPAYLCENLMYVHNTYSNMTLRNTNDFRLPSFKKTSSQQNLFYTGLQKFNSLPINIKNLSTLNIFKRTLTLHLKQQQR